MASTRFSVHLMLLVLLIPEAATCPGGCRCMDGLDGAGGTILCMDTGLTSIPSLDSQTEELYMQGHTIPTIHHRTFTATPHLRILVLENCGIEYLEPAAFAGLKNLTKLSLKGNRITRLFQSMFGGIDLINEINLNNNDIQQITEFTFNGLINNLILKFENNNNLKDISAKAFKNSVVKEIHFYNCSLSNESLKSLLPLQGALNLLYLSSNRVPLAIPHTLFKGFFFLSLSLANNGITDVSFLHHVRAHEISLEYNNIGDLNPSEFPSLKQTAILRLSHTSSKHIDGRYFDGMENLDELDLSYNNITSLPGSLLGVFSTLMRLTLEGNPLHCNCELVWFHKWLTLHSHVFTTPPMCKTPNVTAIADLDANQLQCSAPADMITKQEVQDGNITLLCFAKGDPPPAIAWTLPGGEIRTTPLSSDRSVHGSEGVLLAERPGGTYTCTASNVAGKVSTEIVAISKSTSIGNIQAVLSTLLPCFIMARTI